MSLLHTNENKNKETDFLTTYVFYSLLLHFPQEPDESELVAPKFMTRRDIPAAVFILLANSHKARVLRLKYAAVVDLTTSARASLALLNNTTLLSRAALGAFDLLPAVRRSRR